MTVVCDPSDLVFYDMNYLPHTPYTVRRAANVPRIGKNWVYDVRSLDGRYLVCPRRLNAMNATPVAQVLANDHHEAYDIAIKTLRRVPR